VSLRTGVIIRSTARGLATQTQEAWRGYPFDAALHIIDGNPLWPEDLWPPHRPLNVHRAYLRSGGLHPDEIEPFLQEVDVVFSVETLYDQRFAKVLQHRGIRSVVQGNCELWRPTQPQTTATKWVWPTPWRLPGVPDGPTIPVPVATECRATAGDLDAPLVVVHVAGHRAVGDRNGTELVMQSLPLIKTPVTMRIIGQDGVGTIGGRAMRRNLANDVTVEVCETGVDDRWSMYDGAHVVLLPRRYGGLCLPAQEAMQAGLVPVMTDCEPNRWWPIIPIPAGKGRSQRVPYGQVETWVAHPRNIARRIDELNWNRQLLVDGRAASLEWAAAHTWEALGPMYHDLFNSRF
jgi:hypothetical protein